MIHNLLLYFEGTLVLNDWLFPHADEALKTLSRFQTADGEPLNFYLVSDGGAFKTSMAKLDHDSSSIRLRLDALGLLEYFEPLESHVAIVRRAAASKKNCGSIEEALGRLPIRAALSECLFITEDSGLVASCRRRGMKALRFGPRGGGGDFLDWSEAPLLVARIISDQSPYNLTLALRLRLAAAYDMELANLMEQRGRRVTARAKKLFPVEIGRQGGGTEVVHVPMPLNVTIELDEEGRVSGVESEEPDREHLAEAAHYVKTLESNKQISRTPERQGHGETHVVEKDEKGRKRLKRTRFTAR